jgi:hypothetical protein
MLPTVMTKEVIATRKAFGVAAPCNMTVVYGLGRILLRVLVPMANEVLGVEKALTAY